MIGKKILIFTAGFGDGHNAAARNLLAGVQHLAPEADARVVDLLSDSAYELNDFVRRSYRTFINRMPRIWNLAYALLHHTTWLQDNLWMFSHQLNLMEAFLNREKPDVVVTTYPLYGFFFEKLAKQKRIHRPRHITMVTDSITVNSLWYRNGSDWYIVPNEATAATMLASGVAKEKIFALGFPVSLDFILKRVEPPSLENHTPHILFISSTHLKLTQKILDTLLQNNQWHITLAAGNNHHITEALEKTICDRRLQDRVTILGWTSEMPRLLMSHHVVISKAGGATVQEAIAAHCPMIVSQVVPGQEEGNWYLLQKHDVGALATTPQAITDAVTAAFSNNATQWRQWKQNFSTLSQSNATLDAARFVLQAASGELD